MPRSIGMRGANYDCPSQCTITGSSLSIPAFYVHLSWDLQDKVLRQLLNIYWREPYWIFGDFDYSNGLSRTCSKHCNILKMLFMYSSCIIFFFYFLLSSHFYGFVIDDHDIFASLHLDAVAFLSTKWKRASWAVFVSTICWSHFVERPKKSSFWYFQAATRQHSLLSHLWGT